MIQVLGRVTASTTNCLAGSDLQSAPSAGVVLCWIASTQVDTSCTFTAPPRVAMRNVLLMQRTAGIPSCSDDSPVAMAVAGGEQIGLQVIVVTGAVICFYVKFIPKDEL